MSRPTPPPAAPGSIAAFKAEVDCLDVAERLGLEMRRSGANGAIRCPVHDDRSPSCYVYPNGYKCFACGASGSVIDLVMAVRSLAFGEAVDWIAEATGVPRPQRDPAAEKRAAELRELREACALNEIDAVPFGMDREIARKIGLGRAPADPSLLPTALLTAEERDAWAGRPTIELHARGGATGFGAFLGDETAGPAGFVIARAARGTTVVALPAARDLINRHQTIVVAPDPATAIALQIAGHAAAIAPAAPLAAAHAELIAAIAPRVIVAVAPDRDPLEAIILFGAAGARVEAAPIVEGALKAPIGAFRYLAVRAERDTATGIPALTRYIAALPSPSSAALYRAEAQARGIAV